ncbi:helix-turn-helix domain-containing protein [Halalkalibacter krulwichiae]|uniref:Purine catabolism regulatory protein n=1 Tax=Halalkalibacter krulwichiae TaxID=199441 RepID=A0A1X9M8G0_9BACI|nr:helix-turn-helix domain-containing protein [Halalkalibacter krulwichiae]ARK28880.1 Purine catabolism regulatory protein [Halalkalibacter krulwichiae]
MGQDMKQEKLKQKINSHLRNVTRQLIKFDTLQETLNYLLESFYQEFTCDLVGVILKEGDQLFPKVWIGDGFTIEETLKLSLKDCSTNLLEDAFWWPNDRQENSDCSFKKAMEKEELSTWFTVPLHHKNNQFGFCIIGFRDFVPLVIEAEKIFAEFGHDVAVAMDLAKEKERQKRKIKGLEWMSENIFPGSSIEELIEKIVERAGKGTKAKGASVHLFDEVHNCFTFHPPVYGSCALAERISVQTNLPIDYYFPSVETSGNSELTIPLVVNLKTIGILYVCKDRHEAFSNDDLEFLNFVSAFISMQIENARLYRAELDRKQRLERLMEHHQEILQKTVQGQNLHEITKTISSMLESSLILYDRFLHPLSSYFKEDEDHLYNKTVEMVRKHKLDVTKLKAFEYWYDEGEEDQCGVWPIVGGRDILGYLAICLPKKEVDRVLKITLDHALNVYAMEFIKQKQMLDAKEQVKESFINQLFAEKIHDQEKIIQYATLINWNVLESHQIATFSIEIENQEEMNLFALESYKAWIWNQVKEKLSSYNPSMVFTRKDDEFILIERYHRSIDQANYWKGLYQLIVNILKKEKMKATIYLGIGGKTETLEDYYYCYVQSVKAKNVVTHRFSQGGHLFYDNLGSYTILNNTSDPLAAKLFVKQNLGPLLIYSENHNIDLFETLKVFLHNNGNLREASNQLFIHRSTLEYRLERVGEILGVNLHDAEMRFELMMAYKLYSLFNFSPSQLV